MRSAASRTRIHLPAPLATGMEVGLPAGAARHVQVLRMQPGHALTVFDGRGGEYEAAVTHMGRSDVRVLVGEHRAVEREIASPVHLAVGMPANDRMDWLVEKAAELGASSLQPLVTERSVLRLDGERAAKKVAHWQGIAIAACEQCGRNRLLEIAPVRTLAQWLAQAPQGTRGVLSLREDACVLRTVAAQDASALTLLSGPEGGLGEAEEDAARAAGFQPITLGTRVLRADTAPISALAAWSALHAQG